MQMHLQSLANSQYVQLWTGVKPPISTKSQAQHVQPRAPIAKMQVSGCVHHDLYGHIPLRGCCPILVTHHHPCSRVYKCKFSNFITISIIQLDILPLYFRSWGIEPYNSVREYLIIFSYWVSPL